MRCYNYHGTEAVGVCKSCGRALCPACAAEVEKLVACRGRCESDVATMRSISRNALQYTKSVKQARYLGPAVFVLLGATFSTLEIRYKGFDIATITGGVMIVIGIAFLSIQYRMAKGLRM